MRLQVQTTELMINNRAVDVRLMGFDEGAVSWRCVACGGGATSEARILSVTEVVRRRCVGLWSSAEQRAGRGTRVQQTQTEGRSRQMMG